jgi:hypothetical protein
MFPDTHKKSQKERLKELLSDGLPHDNRELNNIGFAFSQRLNEMKRDCLIDFDNWCDILDFDEGNEYLIHGVVHEVFKH